MTDTQKGVVALIAACCIWGLSGLFYKALSDVPSHEVLAHRIVWSLVFFGIVIGVQGPFMFSGVPCRTLRRSRSSWLPRS